MFFLLNEVNVSFHLIMGTIVLTKQSTTLFCYNSYHLAIKKKALEITHLEGFQGGRSWYIYYAQMPKATRTKAWGVKDGQLGCFQQLQQ